MKKALITLIMALSLSGIVFAQQFRIGLTGGYQFALGDIQNFVSSSAGGAVKGEFDLPLQLPPALRLGISAKVGGAMNVVNNDLLLSMWNVESTAGVYARLLMAGGAFVLQPELAFGAQMNFPSANPEYDNHIQPMYADALIQLQLGLRFAPQKVMKGKLEFSLTPVYSLNLEKETLVHYAGATAGIHLGF